MIRAYWLQIETIDGTEQVAGIDLVHDGLLDNTPDPHTRLLIMDTTPDEHNSLTLVANTWREATQDEIDRYHAEVVILPPNPDITRAQELLANSPDVITQPEMWELARIFGRLLGIPD